MPALLAVVAALVALPGCDWMQKKKTVQEARETARDRTRARQWQQACASTVTYDRLKQIAFDEAIRVRNADPVNLDLLATHSVVRMEKPIVKNHDDALDVTVCTGRFILELPPGAERGFNGERRLVADIEYAAQAAADGSGLVYQISGAEPIIYKLATFDLKNQGWRPPRPAEDTQLADATTAPTPPAPPPASSRPSGPVEPAALPRATPPPAPEPAAAPAPAPAARVARAAPSFNCRYARKPSEQMVCGNERLAALDRAMSSAYYSALSESDARTRADLRRSRDRFLDYRERCQSEGCVAEAYQGRMAEIRDMASGR